MKTIKIKEFEVPVDWKRKATEKHRKTNRS